MKTKKQAVLLRYIVVALATAGAYAASAATVQITFEDNFVSSSTGIENLTADLTGDAVPDVSGRFTTTRARITNITFPSPAYTYGDGNFDIGFGNYRVYIGGGLARLSDPVGGSVRDVTEFSFLDTRINDNETTTGLLDLEVFAGPGGYKVQIYRLIFDDASAAVPTGVTSGDVAYTEWSAVSAVPEASTSLGLLALGAGGILTRRRTKRAA